MSKWRQIKTAPKDGTYVLLYDARYSPSPSSYLIGQFQNNAWTGQKTAGGKCIVWSEATHWKPLDKPPTVNSNRTLTDFVHAPDDEQVRIWNKWPQGWER